MNLAKHITMAKKILVDWKKLFKTTYNKWSKDDPFRQSAVIAYYAIFSIPALLIIVIDAAGIIFGKNLISGKLSSILVQLLGPDAASQIQDTIIQASLNGHTLPATFIGIITTIVGALGVFTELQNSLNYIWEVKPQAHQKFLEVVKSKLFSFGLLLSIGFLLLISLVLTTVLTALSTWISVRFSVAATLLLTSLDIIASFFIVAFLFALMFRYLPSVKTKWKYVWTGGKLTSLLFILGKYGLGVYFGKFHPASAYGTAGSIVLILLWVSYSCMIVFFGAEFTKQYSKKTEGSIVPKKNAVHVRQQVKSIKPA